MPQMAPLMWLILFMFFIFIFFLFNIINYFNFLKFNLNTLKKETTSLNLNNMIWKW